MHTIHRALTINEHWARWLKGQLYGSQEVLELRFLYDTKISRKELTT